MPEVALRFAVFCADGRSTDVWKIWANRGSNKRDVYVTSRPLGYSMKLSLRERGQWHVGFHHQKKDVLFDLGCAPASRFLGRWEAAERIGESPICLAARLRFPWSSPTTNQDEFPVDLMRVESAPHRMAVEVLLFLLDIDEQPDTWPERRSMETKLLGRIPLDGGGGATLVYSHVQMPRTTSTKLRAPRHFAENRSGISRRQTEWSRGVSLTTVPSGLWRRRLRRTYPRVG